jgi:hypothetical protein
MRIKDTTIEWNDFSMVAIKIKTDARGLDEGR